jgi:hypothetical protein
MYPVAPASLLDRLTRVQAAGAPLPWDYDTGTIYAAGDISGIASTQSDQVGALIVAAVNALPELLGVARAAQAMLAACHDDRGWESVGEAAGDLGEALDALEAEGGQRRGQLPSAKALGLVRRAT